MKIPSEMNPTNVTKAIRPEFWIWETVRWPGLTPVSREVDSLVRQLPKKWAVFAYKKSRTFLWAVFLGGTGTGKSTIFNALCGKHLSEAGVERPTTYGPLIYAHRNTPIERDFPFPELEIKRFAPQETQSGGHAGIPGQLLILEHQREELSHLALVDTPDLDSLEIRNREIGVDLYLLADVIIFVTSQEKYADEVPFDFFKRIHDEKKRYLLLLNKAEDRLGRQEVLSAFREHGLDLPPERLWVLPYVATSPSTALPDNRQFQDFAGTFAASLGKGEALPLLEDERDKRVAELDQQLGRFFTLLDQEAQAAKKWLDQLESYFQSSCEDLLEQQREHFNAESRQYLQAEIRRLFGRYDVLGKPRRLIAQATMLPLRLFGVRPRKTPETHKEALLRIRQRIDLAPIQAAIESFNRRVLEQLSPADETSLLYERLRDSGLALTDDEIRHQIWEEQERLALWLEKTFQEMAKGIPKRKEWGIYSTSILWGALILSFEATLGGGITMLDAALDSALAPFVTRGAVEIFAYRELQKVARQLMKRYQRGLLSVLALQRDRYIECLQALITPQETLTAISDQWKAVRE